MSTDYIPVSLRRLIIERASNQCEYCHISGEAVFAPHQVDHIIAQKHGVQTADHNLALSCTLCNKHKGSDLTSIDPQTGKVVLLFNPRQDEWSDHFSLIGGRIIGLTMTGRATAPLLQFNRPDRMDERNILPASGLCSSRSYSETSQN